MIVYVSIGNSDDKLTQAEWSCFVRDVEVVLKVGVGQVMHGAWLSKPDDPWQNACWCIEYVDTPGFSVQELSDWIKQKLARLAGRYRQDSVTWAQVEQVRFIAGVTDGS